MKHEKLLVLLLLAFCSLLPAFLSAQVDTAWIRRYSFGTGVSSLDQASAIKVDINGNVYVTGLSYSTTTNNDYATIKYNTNGETLWVRRFNGFGIGVDYANAIAIDEIGNVYVTGASQGSGTAYDYATIKYNSNGVQQWFARYNGPSNGGDYAKAITVDDNNNIYVTGYSYNAGTSEDYLTIKYNPLGETLWVRRYNGLGNGSDYANAMAIDGQGNVYVTGYSLGSGSSYDYTTIKYNTNGVQQWIQTYNGQDNDDDRAEAIAVDNTGNVYVTGKISNPTTGFDYATFKYNTNGVQQWSIGYDDGPWDGAYAIALDSSNNVYVTGISYTPTSFDDYATIKYNSQGVQQWLARYDGLANNADDAAAVVVDGQGNVYVTGHSYDSSTNNDWATIKYNSLGVQQWIQRYNGSGNDDDRACAIAVGNAGNVYVTGYSFNSGTHYDFTTIKYVQTGAIEEERTILNASRSPLKIYPNPASSYFDVRCPSSVNRSEVKIFNVTGKIVYNLMSSWVGELRVPLNGIKNGIYFIKVGEELIKEKLVVTR